MRHILVIFLILASINAFSEEEKCWEAPSTLERSQCHDRKLKELDADLNREYQEAIKTIKQPHQNVEEEEFRSAQRLWLKFVESDCNLKAKLYGGSGIWQNIEYMQCKEKHLNERINLFMIASGKAAR